ncbi:MAG: hypothetical protein SFU85_10560 [Candidatus Methylacidiphilales bacterium]|nr:hypothetical protein [Candidatus Methylacidiphilales bacterium]
MPRIVIAVGFAGHPIAAAGNSWFFLQWVLGFRDLGWEVWLVESLPSAKLIDDRWQPARPGLSANERHWQATLTRYGLHDHATLLIDDQAANLEEARDFAANADVFLNMSGHFRSTVIQFPRAKKVYLDVDPAFTQIWAEVYGSDMNFAGHDVFFTVGSRLGKDDCRAPHLGINWKHTFPPVCLGHWPETRDDDFTRLTTVAHWQGYSWCEWKGEWYTGKSEQFALYREVPQKTQVPLEIATEIADNREELQKYAEAGWHLSDARSVCADFPSYEAFIRGSGGEFSAAKGGYVKSRCGWFSDRSVCYLAAGRPVIVESTGLEPDLPPQAGLHYFRTLEEAVRACGTVRENYPAERRGARKLAETVFSSRVVIPKMLEKL